jgi:cell volume regulation protein A
LRGAVPIIFSTYPLIAGIPVATNIFNLVFFISVSSVLLQGTTLSRVAKWLHVSVPEKLKRKFPIDFELNESFNTELVELDITETSHAVGKPIMELNLPKSALIVLIHRDGKYITVNGATTIQERDHLLIMADSKKTVNKVMERFNPSPAA